MQASLRSTLLHPTVPEQCRRDAIESRSLVQADKRIGVEPVSADTVTPVDHSHTHIGVVDQRIRERHTGGASSHHQIVSFHCDRHGSTKPRR
jgi:hypothetical protein